MTAPFTTDQERQFWVDLTRPFEDVRIRTVRPKEGGNPFTMHYITSRQVMSRLDEVCGPAGWWDEYEGGPHGVLCRLHIKLPDGTVITKQDTGGYAGMQDAGDDIKSGNADALKRAAVKFGIGRHLYGDGVPDWATPAGNRQPAPPTRPAQQGTWGGRPQTQAPQRPAQPPPNGNPNGPQKSSFRIPKPIPGKNPVWAWIKDLEAHYQANLVAAMREHSQAMGYPRAEEWDQAIINDTAFHLITNVIQELPNYQGEFDNIQYPPVPAQVAQQPAPQGQGEDDEIPF